MGQNNRQRRAAKQRQRARQRSGPGSSGSAASHDHDVHGVGVAASLLGRCLGRVGYFERPSLLQEFRRCAERDQQAAVDEHFAAVVAHAINWGWTPLDLHEVVRRRTKGTAGAHLLDVVAEATAQHPSHLVDPQWQGQLDLLGATAHRSNGVSPAYDWAARTGLNWPAAFDQLLPVLLEVSYLPSIGRVMPAPGTNTHDEAVGTEVDAKVLRRVRGLLAKAESTEHPAEADAFNAKAQELMTRYSIERAMAESVRPTVGEPACRRLWLDSPYVDAKGSLVGAVARANNCRTVELSGWDCVTVVGHPADLDAVELLTTALLVQATRAMTQAGPQQTRYGTSATRSFRRAFLLSYARRIGERLTESAQTTEETYDAVHGGALVPVLTARREAVENKMAVLFPDLVTRRVTVSNAAGWGAGRAAADLARLDVRSSISRAG